MAYPFPKPQTLILLKIFDNSHLDFETKCIFHCNIWSNSYSSKNGYAGKLSQDGFLILHILYS